MKLFPAICASALVLAGLASAARAASPPELISKGEYLARAGDCVVCHTGPGERPFSGGLRMSTPLGDIYTTNITPDKETGIGDYSFEDFERAMRHGVARDGHHLYPAMPYPSYARVSRDDLQALYAFFTESIPAVSRKNSPTEIRWPLNMRWPLRIWNKVFAGTQGFTPDSAQDAAWNRGAYLVQGLGHCGSCHTPRGIFFQEKALNEQRTAYLSGGNLDDWFASSLRSDPDYGLQRWSADDIAGFLKTGHNRHATAFGTMIDAINNAPLAANPAVMDPDPSSLINITLNGSSRVVVEGMPDAYRMPQFRVLLKDEQIAEIVSFIRSSWGNKGGPVTADQVAKIRANSSAASDAVVILKMR
jgi:mono/diheme cytochrome c family protein